jgi:hypothetical protein
VRRGSTTITLPAPALDRLQVGGDSRPALQQRHAVRHQRVRAEQEGEPGAARVGLQDQVLVADGYLWSAILITFGNSRQS